ncbi:MAG TPA: response regulator transcription factor [Bacteroidia bacterium]|nr:response regulator transcription factor [Bacteroidia bacterium]
MVKVLVADKNYLSRVGLELLVGELRGFELVPSVCGEKEDLINQIQLSRPNLVMLDFISLGLGIQELEKLVKRYSKTRFLVITEVQSRAEFNAILGTGIASYLLKECDRLEILEAINASIKGGKYLCSKIVAVLSASQEIVTNNAFIKSLACDGIPVTDREIDIIRAISEGLSNKLIADKLNLSTHTVNTHRKNIMSKLGVNNTAGVVMFAVKNGLLETNFNLHT